MRLDLVCITKDRPVEFREFIQSLGDWPPSCHLHVGDQNGDDSYVDGLLDVYEPDKYSVYKLPLLSLSASRNAILLKIDHTDIIGFPDDDCVYPEGLIEDVLEIFENNSNVVLTTLSTDKIPVNNRRVQLNVMRKRFVLGGIISYTLFFDFRINSKILFDERLGVGTYFGSSEESDYSLRYLDTYGAELLQCGSISIYHPSKDARFNKIREKSYALGLGGFVRKNLVGINFSRNLHACVVLFGPIGKLITGLLRLNFSEVQKGSYRFYYRLKGFLLWK